MSIFQLVLSNKNFQKSNLIRFLASFFGLKSLIFFTPLLFSELFSLKEYSIIEYSITLGGLVSIVLDMGLRGAIPFFIIKKKNMDVKPIFFIHILLVFLMHVVISSLFINEIIDKKIYLTTIFASILVSQSILAIYLKSNEQINKAVYLETGIYIVFAILIGLNSFFNVSITLINLMIHLNYYLVTLVFIALYLLKPLLRSISFERFKELYIMCIKFGVNIIASSGLILLITTSGRLLVEHFLTTEEIGIYSFYFRIASLVVIIHQVVNVAFFKNIYQLNPKKMDHIFSLFIVFIFFISMISYNILPYFIKDYFDIMLNTIDTMNELYLLFSFQMVFWISVALFENIINREELTKKMNKYMLVITSIFFVCLSSYSYFYEIDLLLLCRIHMTLMFVTNITQILLLRGKEINIKKMMIINSSIFTLYSITVIV